MRGVIRLSVLAIVLALVATEASAQSIWKAQVSGTSETVRAVDFIDAQHGWAVADYGVGGSPVLVTSDGGVTWTVQALITDAGLQTVDFVDAQHGWIGGGYGIAYATTDGGLTWTQLTLPDNANTRAVMGLKFVDTQHGWIVGQMGAIYGTVDGGAHWTVQPSGVSIQCNNIDAVSATHAWVGCESGILLSTTDGGLSWSAQFPFGTGIYEMINVELIDDLNGFILTYYEVKKTTNGGQTWIAVNAGEPWYKTDVAFIDPQNGWLIGYDGFNPNQHGVVSKTSNGGATWQAVVPNSAANPYLLAGSFVDADHGWVVGMNGAILGYLPDLGTRALSVQRLGSGSGSVVSSPAGINCGATCTADFLTHATVSLTATPGANSIFTGWSGSCSGTAACVVTLDDSLSVSATFAPTYPVNVTLAGSGSGQVLAPAAGVACAPTCSGVGVGDSVVVFTAAPAAGSWFAGWSGACNSSAPTCTLKVKSATSLVATFGAGAPPAPPVITPGIWTAQNSPTATSMRAVDFVDAMNGWAVGDGLLTVDDVGRILHTSDGGATWTIQKITNDTDLWGVDFVDLQHGWAVGYAKVYATSDGGATWTTQSLPCCMGYALHDVSFADAQHGWIVGIQGQLYATSDGGANWIAQYSGSSADCTVIQAINATTAWRGCASGLAFVTHDGGATWDPQFPFGVNQQWPIIGISFIDDQQGWLATTFELRKTIDGGLTWTPQPMSVAMQGIVFTDAQHGWVAGSNYYPYDTGLIAATTDGGAHWTMQVAPAFGSRPLTALAFADGNHGWAVGFDGTILAYAPKDISPPQIVASVSGTPGSNGWFTSPVQIVWTVSDPQSSVSANGCDPVTLTSDTPGVTFTCSASSEGGSASDSTFVKIDQLAPAISTPGAIDSSTIDPAGVLVSYAAGANDAGSGIASFSCLPASGGTFHVGTTHVQCSALDHAGHSSIAAFDVHVRLLDSTPPSIVASVSGTPGADGWYRSNVTVTFAINDGESAITSSTGCDAVTVSTDTAGQTFTCSATSEGGTSTQVTTIKRDAAAPLLTVSSDVNVTATSSAGAVVSYAAPSGSDAMSGLAGAASCAPASGSTFAIGTTTVSCLVSDQAGNSASRTFSVTVTPQTSSDATGRMIGDGSVTVDDHRVRFEFTVSESDRRGERARVGIRISRGRYGRFDDDRFESRSVSDVMFSNAPAYSPGRNPKSGIDTVVFAGTGRWDRQEGYTYKVTASDRGEPGRNADTFTIEVKAPDGQIVFSGGGAIAEGNVQAKK